MRPLHQTDWHPDNPTQAGEEDSKGVKDADARLTEKKKETHRTRKSVNFGDIQIQGKWLDVTNVIWMLLVLFAFGSVRANSGIIAEINDVASNQFCSVLAYTLDMLPCNPGGANGASWQGRFLVSGATQSKTAITGNPNSQGCLPYYVPFFKEYSYTGAVGTDATELRSMLLPDTYQWNNIQVQVAGEVGALKYERMPNIDDTCGNCYIFAAYSIQEVQTGNWVAEMYMFLDSSFNIQSAGYMFLNTVGGSTPIFKYTQDMTSYNYEQSTPVYYRAHGCQSWLRWNSAATRYYTYHFLRFIGNQGGTNTRRVDHYQYYFSPVSHRGCSAFFSSPRNLIASFAKLSWDNLLNAAEPVIYWQYDQGGWQARMTRLWCCQSSTSRDSPGAIPTKIVQDPNAYASTATLQLQWWYIIGEPTTTNGQQIMPVDTNIGRVVVWVLQDWPNAGCSYDINTFVVDFTSSSYSNLNSYYARLMAANIVTTSKFIFHVIVSDTPYGQYIGSTNNHILSIAYDKGWECSGNQYQSLQDMTLKNTVKMHSAWAANSASSTSRNAQSWGLTCATNQASNSPCKVLGVGTYSYWDKGPIYLAQTTMKFVPDAANYEEGYKVQPSGTYLVQTNGGSSSLIIASARKHASQVSQASAGGADLTRRLMMVTAKYTTYSFWDGWGSAAFLSNYWNPNSVQYEGPFNFWSADPAITGQQPVYIMHWPNNTNSVGLAALMNQLFVTMSAISSTSQWSQYGYVYNRRNLLSNNGRLGHEYFSVEIHGVTSLGWYDINLEKWQFDPIIDQNTIMANRVTPLYIKGKEGFDLTWRTLSTICISSGVAWRQPEMTTCMGQASTVMENRLNSLFEISSPTTQTVKYGNTHGLTGPLTVTDSSPNIATRECMPTDAFTVTSTVISMDVEVTTLPVKLLQSQIATPSAAIWNDNIQMVNVVLVSADGTFYNTCPFNGGFFELNNKAIEQLRTRINEQMKLLVYQRNCAEVQITPTNTWASQTFANTPLQAQTVPLNVLWTNCLNDPPVTTQAPLTYIFQPGIGLQNLHYTFNKFVNSDPFCPVLDIYLQNDIAVPTLYGNFGDSSQNVYVDDGTINSPPTYKWYLFMQTATPFTSLLLVTAKNRASVTRTYQVKCKVCGSETLSTTVTTNQQHIYFRYQNGGWMYPHNFALEFSSNDNPDCPITGYYLENVGGGAFSHASISYPGNVLTVNTNNPFDVTFIVKAITKGLIVRTYQIRIKVCGSETYNAVPAYTSTIYEKGQFGGLVDHYVQKAETPDNVWDKLTSADSECPVQSIIIENPAGTAWSGVGQTSNVIYMLANYHLMINTNVAYDYTIRFKATTSGNVFGYYTMRIRVCGQENPTTSWTTPIQYIFKKDQGAGIIDVADLTSYFSMPAIDLLECPFNNWYINHPAILTRYSNYQESTKSVYIDANKHLQVRTSSPYAPYDFTQMWITFETTGQKKAYFILRVKVCGWETYTHNQPTNPFPYYIYSWNQAGGLVNQGSVKPNFLTNDTAECDFDIWYIETSTLGTVYANPGDTTQKIYVENNPANPLLRIHSVALWAPMDEYVWITAITRGLNKVRYQVRIKVCGAESVQTSVTSIPRYLRYYGAASGTSLEDNIGTPAHFWTTDNTDCPVVNWYIEQPIGNLYASIGQSTQRVYLDGSLKLWLHTIKNTPINTWIWAPNSWTSYWMTAISKGNQVTRYEFQVKVCGFESLVNTATQTRFIMDLYSTTQTLDTRTLRASNDSDCPLLVQSPYYDSLFSLPYSANPVQGLIFAGGNTLTMQTTKPYIVTLYIRSQTVTTTIFDSQEIFIKVCGLETLKVQTAVATQDLYYSYFFNSGIQTADPNVALWFDLSDPECSIVTYEIKKDFFDPQIYCCSVYLDGTQLKVRTNANFYSKLVVRATTRGRVTDYKSFVVRVCGYETLVPNKTVIDFLLDQNTGINSYIVEKNYSKYFKNSDNASCPVISYKLLINNVAQYEGQSSYLPMSWNQTTQELYMNTRTPGHYMTMLQATTYGQVTATQIFNIEICGTENVYFLKNQNSLKLSYVQNSGQNSTQKVKQYTYLSLINSTSYLCVINPSLTQLMYRYVPPVIGSTEQIITYTNNTRVSLDSKGDLRIWTYDIYSEDLLIMVKTNSSKPFYIPLNVVIEKQATPRNMPPVFVNPEPEMFNFTIATDQKSYEFTLQLPDYVDDSRKFKWMNFSNTYFGSLQYRFDSSSQVPSRYDNNDGSMTWNYQTNQIKVTIRGPFKNFNKYSDVIYRINVGLEDEQGASSSKLMLLNITVDKEWLKRQTTFIDTNKYVEHREVAKVEHVSVFGELNIVFNESSEFKAKDFKPSDLEKLKKYVQVYIKPNNDWVTYRGQLEKESLNLTFTIREFTARNLRLKINFNDPTAISPELRYDKVVVYIKDMSSMFNQFKDRRQLLDIVNQLYVEGPVQKQMHDDPTGRKMVTIIYELRWVLTALFIASACFAVAFKAPLQRLVVMILELQFVVNFPILSVTLPGNVQIANTVFKPFVAMDFLKNLNLGFENKPISQEESSEDLDYLGQRKVLRYDNYNAMFNLNSLGILVMLYVAKVIVVIIMIVIYHSRRRHTDKRMVKFAEFTTRWTYQVMFSDFLNLFVIGYTEFLIACLMAIQTPYENIDFSFSNLLFMCILFTSMFLILPFVLYKLYKARDNNETLSKAGLLKLSTNNKRKKAFYAYLILFFSVRTIFLVCAFFTNESWLQTQWVIALFLFNMVMFGHLKPFGSKWANRLQMFNTFFLLICSYHLLIFTEEFVEREISYKMGFSFLITVLVFIMVNLIYFSAEVIRIAYHLFLDSCYSIVNEKCYKPCKTQLALQIINPCRNQVFVPCRQFDTQNFPPPRSNHEGTLVTEEQYESLYSQWIRTRQLAQPIKRPEEAPKEPKKIIRSLFSLQTVVQQATQQPQDHPVVESPPKNPAHDLYEIKEEEKEEDSNRSQEPVITKSKFRFFQKNVKTKQKPEVKEDIPEKSSEVKLLAEPPSQAEFTLDVSYSSPETNQVIQKLKKKKVKKQTKKQPVKSQAFEQWLNLNPSNLEVEQPALFHDQGLLKEKKAEHQAVISEDGHLFENNLFKVARKNWSHMQTNLKDITKLTSHIQNNNNQ